MFASKMKTWWELLSPIYKVTGIFVIPIIVRVCEPRFKVIRYLCVPDFEVNGYLSPILK